MGQKLSSKGTAEAVKGHPAKSLGANKTLRWGAQCGRRPGTQSQALTSSLADLGKTWVRQDRPEAPTCTKSSWATGPCLTVAGAPVACSNPTLLTHPG